jgi:hypothetical protein
MLTSKNKYLLPDNNLEELFFKKYLLYKKKYLNLKNQIGGKGICMICNKIAKSHCSNCHVVSYCSVEHQRDDWKRHEPNCTKIVQFNLESTTASKLHEYKQVEEKIDMVLQDNKLAKNIIYILNYALKKKNEAGFNPDDLTIFEDVKRIKPKITVLQGLGCKASSILLWYLLATDNKDKLYQIYDFINNNIISNYMTIIQKDNSSQNIKEYEDKLPDIKKKYGLHTDVTYSRIFSYNKAITYLQMFDILVKLPLPEISTPQILEESIAGRDNIIILITFKSRVCFSLEHAFSLVKINGKIILYQTFGEQYCLEDINKYKKVISLKEVIDILQIIVTPGLWTQEKQTNYNKLFNVDLNAYIDHICEFEFSAFISDIDLTAIDTHIEVLCHYNTLK